MQVHSGEKPFVCSQCNYSCNQAGKLRINMRIHAGEKPYSCKQCEYSSTRAHILKRDMLTHSGEKPFHCTHCTSSFTQRGNFKEHMSTHQGRGVSVVTSATIHASKLMMSRRTCCSILMKNPLPAISAASLASGQVE